MSAAQLLLSAEEANQLREGLTLGVKIGDAQMAHHKIMCSDPTCTVEADNKKARDIVVSILRKLELCA